MTYAAKNTFNGCTFRLHFTSSPLLRLRLKDKVSDSAASFCLYRFTCSRGAYYIARTTTCLSERIHEHHPAWLGNEFELERFKSTSVNCCYQDLNSKSQNKNIITKEHFERSKILKNNENIVISKPNKDSGIVLLNRSDYIDKMKVILNDKPKFHKMENVKDRRVQKEKALSRPLRELKEQNAIDQITFKRIRPVGFLDFMVYQML